MNGNGSASRSCSRCWRAAGREPSRCRRSSRWRTSCTPPARRHKLLEALLTFALGCWWDNPDQATRDRVVAVANRLAPPDKPALLSILALTDPVNRGRGFLERLRQAGAQTAATRWRCFTSRTQPRAFGRTTWPSRFLAAAIDGVRAHDDSGSSRRALVSQAWAAVHVADARVATPAAAEGGRLSEETGQPRWAASAKLAQATMAAERGDAAGAEELTASTERLLVPMGANPILSSLWRLGSARWRPSASSSDGAVRHPVAGHTDPLSQRASLEGRQCPLPHRE